MKKLITSLVGVGLVGALSGCASSEPKVICNVGRGQPFAMQYKLKAGQPAACAATETLLNVDGLDADGNPRLLNQMGLEGYVSDTDLGLNTVAIRPGEYKGVAVPDGGSAANPNALGSFGAFYPDASNLCTVATFTPASKTPTSYSFANLKSFNDPSHAGTQIQMDLTYVDASNNTCAFTVVGTWPAVGCAVDADCDPVGGQHPVTSPANIYGSGIAADYPTKCINSQCQVDTSKGTFPYLGAGNYGPN